MRWIGMDVHKHFAHIVELTPEGITDDYRVEIPEGLAEFKERLGPDAEIVLEATTSGFRVQQELAPHVKRALVAHPAQTRGAIAHSAVTDRRAAEVLARLLASGFIRTVWVPPPEIRALRNLVEHRFALTQIRTATTQRLRSLFQQELFEDPGRRLWNDRTRGFLDGIFRDEPCHLIYAESLCTLHDFIDQRRDQVDAHLANWVARSDQGRLLLTITGVGPILAAYLVAGIGDVERFPSARHLCSYAGLVPRVYASGKTVRIGAISKAGRGTLRWAAGIAAMQAGRRPGPLGEFCQRLRTRRPAKVAIVATARKLLATVWHVLKNREPHRGHDPELLQRKLRVLKRMAKSR